eukprot:TRINITY_DN59771_c0_g1_i5.p1 TRINITY_DN59771_c0_g1~~TRINITY_DN59771_c0_g1_i5.p1  ORF type:complete len:391 (+),score=53.44 TRINITY_DN59771_c0_g1_i5:73-1245(+)
MAFRTKELNCNFSGCGPAMLKLYTQLLALQELDDDLLMVIICLSSTNKNEGVYEPHDAEQRVRRAVAGLRCFVIGVVDGSISINASALLYACDFVVATSSSRLHRSSGEEVPVSWSAGEAKLAGLVDVVARNNQQAMQIVAGWWSRLKDCDMEAGGDRETAGSLRRAAAESWSVTMPTVIDNVAVPEKASGSRRSANVASWKLGPPKTPATPSTHSDVHSDAASQCGQTTPEVGAEQALTGSRNSTQDFTTGSKSVGSTDDESDEEPPLKNGSRKPSGSSLMLCNLPCRCNLRDVMQAVDGLGFAGKYQYIHLPSGGHSRRHVQINLGYAFINFFQTTEAAAFAKVFEGFKFPGREASGKSCTTKPTHLNTPRGPQLREILAKMKCALLA